MGGTMMASQNAEPVQPAQHRDLWPGIAGLAAGGLLIAGYVLWTFTPDVTGTDALRTVVLWYLKESNQDQSEALALILLAAGLLFMWFLVALSRLAGNRSHLVLVGGTVFTAFLLVGALAGNIFAITVRTSDVFPVLPETSLIAILLLNTAYGAIIASMVGAAVMLFAVWRASQETHAIPAWLGWAGLVVAVLSLAGPWSAWLTPILLAAWVLAASVVLILNALTGKEEAAALNPQPLPPQPER
ncbi:hypothetical protein OG741_16510 [Streptomyces sp. NBC_01410]|uniref:hypothetical protein n=1 Tax=Streptomyces sp. NBC_01410 TaxID=2903856 RepID=UPI0032550E5A